MEKSEVSLHEVCIYRAMKNQPEQWLTNAQIEALTPGVAARTVRAHTKKLVALGLLDQAKVFPAHRYRWSKLAEKRNLAYAQRLEQASFIFGEG